LDCAANAHSKDLLRYRPSPLAYQDDLNLPVELHPWIKREWRLPYEFEDLTS